jgi:hypothetical protein
MVDAARFKVRAELRTGGEVIPLRPMHVRRNPSGSPMVLFDGTEYSLRFDLERLHAATQRLIVGRYPLAADAVREILSDWPELGPAPIDADWRKDADDLLSHVIKIVNNLYRRD